MCEEVLLRLALWLWVLQKRLRAQPFFMRHHPYRHMCLGH